MLKKILTVLLVMFIVFPSCFVSKTTFIYAEGDELDDDDYDIDSYDVEVCDKESEKYDEYACKIQSQKIGKIKREIQEQMDAAEASKEEKGALISEYETEIDSLQYEIDDLQEKIDELQVKIDELQENIDKNEEEVGELNERVKSRMISSQKTMHFSGYLDFICGSKSFSDLLRRIYGVNALLSKDSDDREKLITLINQLNSDKAELDTSKAELDESEEELVDKQISFIYKKEAVEEEIRQIEAELEELNNNLAPWDSLSKYYDQARMVISSGGFVPCVHNSYISSGFPYRDTSFNYGQVHLGIDYAASYGEEIHAPANGICIFSYNGCEGTGYYGSWCGAGDSEGLYGAGNQVYLMCQVDDGVYGFIMMHLSDVAVETGEVVEQDDVIGYVGSSGSSTGPHCHIEMYYLGEGEIVDYLDINYDGTFLCGRGESCIQNHMCNSTGSNAPCILNPEYYLS